MVPVSGRPRGLPGSAISLTLSPSNHSQFICFRRRQASGLISLAALLVETGKTKKLCIFNASWRKPLPPPWQANPLGRLTLSRHRELSRKRLEVFREAVPNLARVAVLYNPDFPSFRADLEATESAARSLGLTLQSTPISHTSEFDEALAGLITRQRLRVVKQPSACIVRARR